MHISRIHRAVIAAVVTTVAVSAVLAFTGEDDSFDPANVTAMPQSTTEQSTPTLADPVVSEVEETPAPAETPGAETPETPDAADPTTAPTTPAAPAKPAVTRAPSGGSRTTPVTGTRPTPRPTTRPTTSPTSRPTPAPEATKDPDPEPSKASPTPAKPSPTPSPTPTRKNLLELLLGQ
ncbi:hypothetical protein [Aeromicrobium fastidiosum]|uniref:Uncharacterized protein n=1 Tax=Aeromicrobium fastidiosum TaxID=52699 RepID=A0A641AKJ2_9ACTN|nr:hypothetical protein [Aeromicrobium fastidiosum]KAA1373677.1 hypothetical protein ESP62_017125 [Aeromicrobium fastidiosum]MBP2391234.1 hypothetical protein [Aeromicrobium fastidiosum]